jgi:hypothetical protein
MLGLLQEPDWYPGWIIFLMGWMGPFIGQFGWFANFLVPIAVVDRASNSRVSRRSAKAAAAMLLLLAINSAFWQNIPNDASLGPITSYGIGYYFWMAAVLLSAASLTLSRNSERGAGEKRPPAAASAQDKEPRQ